MVKHHLEYTGNSIAACGEDMVGRRGFTFEKEPVTCILCRAILDRKPVFAVATEDEDGYHDVNYFTNIIDQIHFVDDVKAAGAEVHIMYVLQPDDIKNDDYKERINKFKDAVKIMENL